MSRVGGRGRVEEGGVGWWELGVVCTPLCECPGLRLPASLPTFLPVCLPAHLSAHRAASPVTSLLPPRLTVYSPYPAHPRPLSTCLPPTLRLPRTPPPLPVYSSPLSSPHLCLVLLSSPRYLGTEGRGRVSGRVWSVRVRGRPSSPRRPIPGPPTSTDPSRSPLSGTQRGGRTHDGCVGSSHP